MELRQVNPPNNFGGIDIDEIFYNYSSAKFVILQVPYEGTVTYGGGTANGPEKIIEASQNMELYDEQLRRQTFSRGGICTLEPLECKEKKSLLSREAEFKNPKIIVDDLEFITSNLLANDKFVVTLGGEHSISTGPIRAYKNKFPNLSVLQLDAHADLRQEYEGSKFNHACVMARVREICPAVQVGIRSLSKEEADWIDKDKLKIWWAHKIIDNERFNPPMKKHKWHEIAINQLTDDVYVTIDLDVFDPSIMSATGTPEPGGLDWYCVNNFLNSVSKKKNIVGFDIVELAPNSNNSCEFLAAKLAYRMIAYCSK